MLFETTAETDIVDLSLLKCRQKDQLGEVFKSWGYDVPCNSEQRREYICREGGIRSGACIALEVCIVLNLYT